MTGKAITLAFCLFASASPLLAKSYHLDKHNIELGFRPRVARVDSVQNADAASLLLRARFTSQWTDKLQTRVELDYVHLWLEDKFTNGVHFNNTPVVPDAAGLDLNQLVLRYRTTNTFSFSVGREVLNWGNERFVGSNNFWQNEQSFDSVGFDFAFGSASQLRYRHVNNANRINGERATAFLRPDDANYQANNGLRPAKFLGDHKHDTHLFLATIQEFDYAHLQAYFYDMDIIDAPALSNRTWGLRYEYKKRMNSISMFADAEFAIQNRPNVRQESTPRYFHFNAGLGYRNHQMAFDIEQLGEQVGIGFVTPLASLHNFNGWADKFLVTPNTGLNDYSIRYILRLSPFKLNARYHFFATNDTQSSLGQELDIDLSYKLSHQSVLLLRFADFTTQSVILEDETRVFVQFNYGL